MAGVPRFGVSEDLVITVGNVAVRVTPRHGLRIAEDLARKAFRRILIEEAAKLTPGIDSQRPGPICGRQG